MGRQKPSLLLRLSIRTTSAIPLKHLPGCLMRPYSKLNKWLSKLLSVLKVRSDSLDVISRDVWSVAYLGSRRYAMQPTYEEQRLDLELLFVLASAMIQVFREFACMHFCFFAAKRHLLLHCYIL